MKIIMTIAALIWGSLTSEHLHAENAGHISLVQAQAGETENDRLQQEAQRKQEAAESTAVVTERVNPKRSDAGTQKFMSAIKYRQYRWADFDQVVFNSKISFTDDMMRLMGESPYAADIAYYLGKHPDDAAAIERMPLAQSGPAIRAIEDKVKPSPVG